MKGDAPDASALFSPFELGALKLPNRIVMAPMTRAFSPNGVPGTDVAAYYRRRAEGGVGLIVTEGAWIPNDGASNEENVPNLFGEHALRGWEEVVSQVHAAGSRIVPQLWHVGLILKPVIANVYDNAAGLEPRHMGPSGVAGGIGYPLEFGHRIMTTTDIDEVIEAYLIAAASAQRIGFDGIELHAAHGYLIDQFFWDVTNRREDGYGGKIAVRARFGAEVVTAIRRKTGPDFPIVMRISQWKQHDFSAKVARSPAELEAWLAPLVDAGVDAFHCSQRRYWEPEFPDSTLNFAGWTKKVTGRPTITVGSVSIDRELFETTAGEATERQDIDLLLRMLEREEFDLVAVGRGLIADADWPRRIRSGGSATLSHYSSDLLGQLN